MGYKDPAKDRAYGAAYRAAYPEETKAANDAWRAAYPEKSRQSSANWKAAHPEARAAYQVTYRAEHPEIHLLNNARRRARRKSLPATLTEAEWESIQAAYQYKCACCGKPPPKGKKLTQDHVIPEIKGGGWIKENIVPACGPCNSGKRDSLPKKPVRLVLV